MAIISMKKLTLVGYDKDKSKVLKNLQKVGCFEIQRSELLEMTFSHEDTDKRDEITNALLRLQFVFDFLKSEKRVATGIIKAEEKADKKAKKAKQAPKPAEDRINYQPKKKQLFNPTPRFSFDDFYEITNRENEIFDKISELENISQRYADIKAEITKLQSTKTQLEVFKSFDVKLSAFTDTAHTSIVLGVINSAKLQVIDEIKNEFPVMYIEIGEGNRLLPVAIVAMKDEIDKIVEKLNDAEFLKSSFAFEMTAADKLKEIGDRISELFKEKQSLLEKSLSFEDSISDFKQLYDYYSIENARLQASDGFALTKSSFILEGWYPADCEEKVLNALNESSDALVIETREPLEGDSVPTLTRNNKIVDPYDCITNMYSVPNYHDVDPNPFVAFFYFLMFGIMMGDAVYGLILMLGGFLAYYFMKPAPGKGKLFLVIGMGGLSTFIWGILFGGWLSLPVDNTFLAKLIMFKPIDETNPNTALYMLILSIAIGLLQINVGLGIHAYDLIKNKKDIVGAFSDVFSWYSVLLGIIFFGVSLLAKIAVLKTVGIVFIALGIAMLFITSFISAKGAKKITGGFSKLYGGLNFLSDILSYSRLFGLGLSTTVIGMVVNEICKVIINLLPSFGGVPVLGVIFSIPVFLIGHIFNIGINTLGTYVHNSRLQFIEFFGRFYEGGGHVFKPLGSNTKYTYIEK